MRLPLAIVGLLVAFSQSANAREMVATPDEVKQVLSGCWQALTRDEIDGKQRSQSDTSDIVCFDFRSAEIRVQPADQEGLPTQMAIGGTYSFANDRFILTSGSDAESWFWPLAGALHEVGCDVHLRSEGIVILSACKTLNGASAEIELEDVVLGVVAPRAAGSPVVVSDWRQLEGCWYGFNQDHARSSDPGSVYFDGYCFEAEGQMTSMSGFSNGIVNWKIGRGDGEGLEKAMTYAISNGRLNMSYEDVSIYETCLAKVIIGARLIFSACDQGGGERLYLRDDTR